MTRSSRHSDSLERQWRDHVGDGLVVRWFKRLVRRVKRWRAPTYWVALRLQLVDGVEGSRYTELACFPILPGEEVTWDFYSSVVVPPGFVLVVGIVIKDPGQ